MKGRQILDAVLIANECIHSLSSEGLPGLVCKLDFKNAFDKVDWSFILSLLRRTGFGTKWTSWILKCVPLASFSVLINGSPKGFFPAQRGLHQWDPLSLFHFVIVGKALCCYVVHNGEGGLISGFMVAKRVAPISRLQFADDTLLLCEASEEQVKNIKATLMH